MKTLRFLITPLLLALALPVRATTITDPPPRPVKRVPPVYTEAMRTNPVYGEVSIECDVDAQGLVTGAKVGKSLSSDADRAALESVQKWIFEPATKDGQPVATHFRMSIRFGPPPSGLVAKFDTPPKPLKQVPPASTDAMRRSSLRGTVTIECIVDEKGRVTDAKVARPLTPEADQAALECAQKWLFKPATKDGQPVKARMLLPFQFSFN
jgi:TonB family protein